ncbi:NADP-dependent oxidoreductase [Nocardia pseudovaccinii]|uniref:NADP-dependent oxidoreductase n=1 Tax=Nocardia pseudovaccinii TaxID=189540 RepID=UPI0007A44704|nr:NADP-dependent oxidoreductase [Nocardia pseudovaccinii]
MRAVVVRRPGPEAVAEIIEVPTPEPGPGAVRVKVAAATVNPVDLMVRNGVGGTPFAAPRDQWGIGWDVAGIVDTVGAGVDFTVGQQVIGISDRLDVSLAAQADYVVLEAQNVAPAPTSVPATAAATIPLNGLTAVQALAALDLTAADSLLITGAAGAVGGFAVELAAARGVRVIASASPGDEPTVRALGATDFIPRGANLPDAARALVPGGVDAALDAAALGPETLAAVRARGRFISISVHATPIPLRGTEVTTVLVHADRSQLDELVALVDKGHLTLRVAETYSLDAVAAAHQRLAAGGLRGRLVLVP